MIFNKSLKSGVSFRKFVTDDKINPTAVKKKKEKKKLKKSSRIVLRVYLYSSAYLPSDIFTITLNFFR